MRIAQVVIAPLVGGAHSLVGALATAWREQGHAVDILAIDAAPSEESERVAAALFSGNVPVINTHTRTPVKQINRILRLRRAVQMGRYDVVQTHTLIPNAYGRLAFPRGRPPTVITIHSLGSDYISFRATVAERLLAKSARRVVAVSVDAAAAYARAAGVPLNRVTVIPNGMTWKPTVRERAEELPRVFLSTARLSPEKDIVTMLRGFDAFLGETHLEARLWIAGPSEDADYRRRVDAVRASLPHADSIEFLGARADVAHLLSQADVFVQTSLRETHSIALIEAAASGVPIVASSAAYAGLSPVVAEMSTRHPTFEAGDARKFELALIDLLSRWHILRDDARLSSRRIADHFSFESCARAHLNVLESAVRG